MKIRIRTAALIIKDNSILLVEHKKADKAYWLLPGGGVKTGETLVQALKRELFEETSLNIKVDKLLFVSESISPNNDRHILQLVFKSFISSGKLSVNPDHRLCDAKFIQFSKINEIILRPNTKKELIELLEKGSIKKLYLGNTWE